jgi:pSer/pThr/pTyr-binding forkhead associated (FHA) protein
MPHLTLLDKSGRTYRVDSTDAVVGRDPAVALVMQGDGSQVVSGRHARFFLADGAWWIEDVGSRNGTYVGGQRLKTGDRRRLNAGDEVALGSSGPRFQVEEAEGRDYSSTPAEPVAAVPMATMMESRPAAPPHAAAAQHVRMIVRSAEGKRLVGQDTDVIIGRSIDCTLRMEGDMSMAVSRRHARIFYSGWKICIEDAGSRNGTWLNRKRVQGPTVIERGDVIEFGAGGPSLTVEDIGLVPADSTRKSRTDLPVPAEADPNEAFMSELPTPAPRPAARASGDKR